MIGLQPARTNRYLYLLLISYIAGCAGDGSVSVSTQYLDILVTDSALVTVSLGSSLRDPVVLEFYYDNEDIIKKLEPVTLSPAGSVNLTVQPLKAGHVTVTCNTSDPTIQTREAYFKVDVIKSDAVELISTIIGWTYFVAWSVSFYPQIWENLKRKSVIGLNFDFCSLNIVGHTVYGIFNIGLFWIPSIQEEYKDEHPTSVIPVQPNDVFFSIHAVAACTVVIIQIFIYERGQQRVSRVCWAMLLGIFLFLGISLIVSLAGKLSWLQFLNFCSYVKLGITLVKYIPQAVMNFRRKSTVGWSIGNILLDFTGGMLSIIQMFLISYNNDDWESIFGDFTKFGLGAISVLFDVMFMVQHYWLYRGNMPHEELESLDREDTPSPHPPTEENQTSAIRGSQDSYSM